MKLNSNDIIVCRRNYNSDKELFDAIGDIINHLTKNQEECLVYADEIGSGIYVIRHAHDNRYNDYGDVRFMIVTSKEEDEILARREEANEEELI